MITVKELKDFINSIYDPSMRKVVVPYVYPVTFSALAAGATATQNVNITANADFVHTRTAFHATANPVVALNVGNLPVPAVRILINDSGTNENFMQSAVDLGNFATVQVTGFTEDHTFPRVISGRSNVSIQATSYESATTYNIDIALIGVLVRAYNT